MFELALSNNSTSAPRIRRQAQQDGAEFSYVDADRWRDRFPMCGGTAQSPVNLRPFDCNRLQGGRSSLTFINAFTPPRTVELINNGHTVRFVFHWNRNNTARITGGPLNGAQYIPHEVHFHWTNGVFGGTEHAIYGFRFTMEMHVVCYNAKYRNLEEAMNFADGILVLAQLFKRFIFGDRFHFLQTLPYVRRRGSRITINYLVHLFTLDSFLNVNRFNRNFVSYIGSLTTPPCREQIQWIVNVIPRKIAYKAMRLFNGLQGSEGFINDNVRPLQPMNGRPYVIQSVTSLALLVEMPQLKAYVMQRRGEDWGSHECHTKRRSGKKALEKSTTNQRNGFVTQFSDYCEVYASLELNRKSSAAHQAAL
ncbi:carbonic anhydrase-like [Phlebotomus argentipes]|uniref:carbonic anhydrase-like n=1 Tax=Phlebotomus argentipes TaxID=94469 RepID=UPI002893739A|nr:carbonic anhydrase-like [Phlebotomus argentipes]